MAGEKLQDSNDSASEQLNNSQQPVGGNDLNEGTKAKQDEGQALPPKEAKPPQEDGGERPKERNDGQIDTEAFKAEMEQKFQAMLQEEIKKREEAFEEKTRRLQEENERLAQERNELAAVDLSTLNDVDKEAMTKIFETVEDKVVQRKIFDILKVSGKFKLDPVHIDSGFQTPPRDEPPKDESWEDGTARFREAFAKLQ